MASEYRAYSDFPWRALPLWSWPDLSRVMFTAYGCALVLDSLMVDSLNMNSIVHEAESLNSPIVDALTMNSIMC